MAAIEESGATGAHGSDIIRESSSSPEPVVRPLGRSLPGSRRVPRRWSWRHRMPSQHSMTLRSHTRGIAAAPSGSLLAGDQPPSLDTTVQEPYADSETDDDFDRVLGSPSTPARPAGWAWFHDLSERQNVAVLEDTEDQETLEALTPVLYSGFSEDKENDRVSNLNVLEPEEEPAPSSSDVDTPPRNDFVDRSILEAGPRDVFGLPFNLLSPLPDTTNTTVPTAIANTVYHPHHNHVQGTAWSGDDQTRDEWDETNSEIVLRELLDVGYFNRTGDNEQ
ncbi:hypothetical protein F1880_002436 [Penicillium rolfsii]|nr:hypothetical protein F1880_002436 [Penicillium rolfsii]